MDALGCFLTFLLLLAHGAEVIRSNIIEDECRHVPAEDIKDAIYASHNIYKLPLTNEDIIPGTFGYVVTKELVVSMRGQELKGVIATKESPPTTLISFQGTNAPIEGLQQFLSIITEATTEVQLKTGHEFEVIDYYWEAVSIFKAEMAEISKTWTNNTKFIMTGHSLGGALATLYSLFLIEQGLWSHPDNALITFGTPRMGDENFALAHDQLIPYHRKVRMVYDRDIIAHIPAHNILFDTFFHPAREVWSVPHTSYRFTWLNGWFPWYESYTTMEWTVCPKDGENTECSNGLGWLRITDHATEKYLEAFDDLFEDEELTEKLMIDQCPV